MVGRRANFKACNCSRIILCQVPDVEHYGCSKCRVSASKKKGCGRCRDFATRGVKGFFSTLKAMCAKPRSQISIETSIGESLNSGPNFPLARAHRRQSSKNKEKNMSD